MSQGDPIRVYVTHGWQASDDYLRVFEYLESAKNFYYRNLSAPDAIASLQVKPQVEAQREIMRKQMAAAEVIIALSSLYFEQRDLLVFQLQYGKACDRPVILLNTFGRTVSLPKDVASLADEVIEWDERALSDAVRRHARHQDTTRWDTIEFKLD
jgi:hypothetical protein